MSRDKKVACDLVVVGAGVSGKAAARRGASHGLRTVLIDHAWSPATDPALKTAGVNGLLGRGRLAGPGRVRVTGDGQPILVTASRVILATGSRPTPLSGVLFDGQQVLADDHLHPEFAWPATAIVVGAGAVGVRRAAQMQAAGCRVTLVARDEQILTGTDPDCVGEIRRWLTRAGIVIRTGARVRNLRVTSDGVRCQISDRASGAVREYEAAAVLVATGRRPHVDDLGLDAVDIVQDRQGCLLVDGVMQTPQPGLYAVGDLVPSPRQPHIAQCEGHIAADHAAGQAVAPLRYQRIPLITPSQPEVAALGLTEPGARRAGYRVRCRLARFGAPDAAVPTAVGSGLVKVVGDADSGGILGLHLVSCRASGLIAAASAALGFDADLRGWPPAEPEGELSQELHRTLRGWGEVSAAGGGT
jgi:dihydrolipoamide dehydrogenase